LQVLADNHPQAQGSHSYTTPEKLAGQMTALAHKIRALLIAAFENGTCSCTLQSLFEACKWELQSNLAIADFADLSAQAITYGLFAAYAHSYISADQRSVQASMEEAVCRLLQNLPLNRTFPDEIFAAIMERDAGSEALNSLVSELIALFKQAPVDDLLAPDKRKVQQREPLMHFYETFLAQYDPRLRGKRGVYYTPQPVVSYIVRSVDTLLRSQFGRCNGLSGAFPLLDEPRMLLLDPACGTGAFLSTAIDLMRKPYRDAGNPDMWREYVREQLLPGIVGFELLLTPYLIAHLSLNRQLAALDLPEAERHNFSYHCEDGEHLGIYHGNALEELVYERGDEGRDDLLPLQAPIIVVLGNPPFAGHSSNKGKWIVSLLDAYKDGCPELKKPAQAKWLSDDYVKFIRLAQWYVEQTGRGIVTFVTNHSYLDNPTFRGMRRSLLQAFDDIYILDLHGNSKKKERTPGASKDENVFDIQQGVAISIFVKWREGHKDSFATVHHADLWGLREIYQSDAQGQPILAGGKYDWLAKNDLASTDWTIIKTEKPLYLFAPQDTQYLEEYETRWSIPAIFQLGGDPAPGMITCHDDFAISWSKDEAAQKVERLLATATEAEARQLFRLCSQDQWQYDRAKMELAQENWRQDIVEVLYRPFDRRWTVFNRSVAVHRRERVMRHMLRDKNIGLAIGRAGQVIHSGQWDIVFCTRYITEFNLFRRGGNYLFPLYLYTPAGERRANLAPQFIKELSACLSMTWRPEGHGDLQRTFGPEDVFAYIYAMLHSSSYRERYAPFLKRDFPRIPLTSNANLFRAFCHSGNTLLSLHLMEDFQKSQDRPLFLQGSNVVEIVRFERDKASKNEAKGRIWINATQYFADVPLDVWMFSIGGYQVCQKWLKDRLGRRLGDDEMAGYRGIIAALRETVEIMGQIDIAIKERGGFPIST
jgi:predicted helicase